MMAGSGSSEQPSVGDSGGLPGVLTLGRRLLNYPLSIGLLLEVSLLGAIPYLIVGAVVSVLSGEGWRELRVEQGSDALVPLVTSVVAWPVLLIFRFCVS